MMLVTAVSVRDFRAYERATVSLGPGLNVIHGPNGAGKTNLLESLYFGCTGRSCRTSNEREVVRFGAPAARVVVSAWAAGEEHELSVGFAPGEPKRLRADGAPVERLTDVQDRPLVSVFMPDRLELIKGPPALRRGHIDQVVAALWPARASTRRSYVQTLAQRNALLARVRGGRAAAGALDTWDQELARHAVVLRDHRAEVVGLLGAPFAAHAARLGLAGAAVLDYRPRTRAPDGEQFVAELLARRASDLERGFSGHGPHRDDLALTRAGRELRAFGSQGEQRLALLSLLLAEREVLLALRDRAPLMLLDDVMSELDAQRRTLLVAELMDAGQSIITTTELAHVPGALGLGVTRLRVSDGVVELQALAA